MKHIRITNCHTHLFTSAHVPDSYPHWALRPLKSSPNLVTFIAWILSLLGFDEAAVQVRRLRRFQEETASSSQQEVLEHMRLHYPTDTRFVVLPMDLSQIGYGAPSVPLADQHDDLHRLATSADFGPSLIPFATIDPRADPQAKELWRAIDSLGFKGIKIYPRLGFSPTDPVLMEHVYPRAEQLGLPVMTHCSRGGVKQHGLPDRIADHYTDPMTYLPVLKRFPDLKVCLAHFGGQRDWEAYVNPELPSPYHDERVRNWQVMIRQMICSGDYPNLWTDISYTLFDFEEYIPFLRTFLTGDDEGTERLRSRVLFGSDFYMTRQEALSERAVCIRLRNALGEELFHRIAEVNPEVWLGERA
ncbi:amidohydrolase family protein [Chachezhania sediminis]|uniref:amidohydrolase family protein n=1 Tax=Chachezhania sediminis TaxID=2599291 RepID=UPI00131C2C42|nr:amidohydrolase family protein [Chachezhania sediminis]